MSDFTIKSDNVDVEQIMRQVRARIREKRGVDYTEDEIRELASVKLERFLDPKGVRSDLLEQYRKRRDASTTARNYAFEDTTLYESSRPLLRFIRRLLNPILKLFFNPTPMIEALHIQSRLNDNYNQAESLYYELIHNLVLEMRVESMSSRLDFDERRARALEGVVLYRPGAVAPLQPPAGAGGGQAAGAANGQNAAADAERRNRRRRRRGRRRPGGPQGPGGERGDAQGFAAADSGGEDGGADAGPAGAPPAETGTGPAES
jgi:hypothetical protein